MNRQFIAAAMDWLSTSTTMAAAQRERMASLIPDLLGRLPEPQPCIIGVCGAPGTGKTTLAGACAAALNQSGHDALVLSLDDYYLPKARRKLLSEQVHPLLGRRGVPGTHELDLLKMHLEMLGEPGHEELRLPVFDKSKDERSANTKRVAAHRVPSHIIVEGWCVGVPGQTSAQLAVSLNDFEASQDPDGAWRDWVNLALLEYTRIFDGRLDARWLMRAPDWTTVIGWRWQQEQDNPRRWLNDRESVTDFLQTYQRICDHMNNRRNDWADVIIELDQLHMPSLAEQS